MTGHYFVSEENDASKAFLSSALLPNEWSWPCRGPTNTGQRGIASGASSLCWDGLITGAADDDPSAIGAYSVVGVQCGTTVFWTAFITWPLIAAIQMMCTRIASVTGGGLARALGEKFPRPLVVTVSLGLLVANTITVGADLSANAGRHTVPPEEIGYAKVFVTSENYCPLPAQIKRVAKSLGG